MDASGARPPGVVPLGVVLPDPTVGPDVVPFTFRTLRSATAPEDRAAGGRR